MDAGSSIVAVNGGSSSLKFVVFAPKADDSLELLVKGHFDRVGGDDASLTIDDRTRDERITTPLDTLGQDDLAGRWSASSIAALARPALRRRPPHRARRPALRRAPGVTSDMLGELHRLRAFDPDHLPGEIALVEALQALSRPATSGLLRYGLSRRHAASGPTAGHSAAIRSPGRRRYGFHGLSYAYLMEEASFAPPGATWPRAA